MPTETPLRAKPKTTPPPPNRGTAPSPAASHPNNPRTTTLPHAAVLTEVCNFPPTRAQVFCPLHRPRNHTTTIEQLPARLQRPAMASLEPKAMSTLFVAVDEALLLEV